MPLKRAGREWKGLSPFNKEKTPSFTVNDQKGFYHCFSSGKHGDIFTFVMETEGLSFPEAVEKLAGEAGLDAAETRPAIRAHGEGAARPVRCARGRGARSSRTRSWRAKGARRLRYAEQRGLTRDTLKEFRIGFAPNAQGCAQERVAQEGLHRGAAYRGGASHQAG